MIQYLQELCSLRGIAGDEKAVREYIRQKAVAYADTLEQDAMGNLLIFKKGAIQRRAAAMLCAHMDESGFRVKIIREDGTLVIDMAGDISPICLPGSRVKIGAAGLVGVLTADSPLRNGAERDVLPIDQLLLDIGAPDKKTAESLVELGDPVTLDSEWRQLGNGKIKSRALESRIGCAALLTLLSEPLPFDTWFAFTSHDTIKANGFVGRGSSLAVAHVHPRHILFVESRDAYDFDAIQPSDRNLSLGKGCAVLVAEKGSAYTRGLHKLLTDRAAGQGIPWQYPTTLGKFRPSSRTAVPVAGGAASACFAAPVRYMNTANAVAEMGDIESLLKLSRLFIAESEAYHD